MVDFIARYLSYQRQVSVKGIGTFSLKDVPARLDFPNRLLHAPQTELEFSASSVNDEAFNQWLQSNQQLSAGDVKQKMDIFIHQFQQQLSSNETVEWKGMGSFLKTENNVLQFQPAFETFKSDPVSAERIIRKDAEHYVRVGEEEKTSTEMEELLFGKQKRNFQMWWFFALALLLLGVVAVWLYSNNKASEWKMQGNGNKIKTEQTLPAYKVQ